MQFTKVVAMLTFSSRILVFIAISTSCETKEHNLENTKWFYDYFLNSKNEKKYIRILDKYAQAIIFKKRGKIEKCYYHKGSLFNCEESQGQYDLPLERNFWKIDGDTLELPNSTNLIISINKDSMVLQHLNFIKGSYILGENKFVYKRVTVIK